MKNRTIRPSTYLAIAVVALLVASVAVELVAPDHYPRGLGRGPEKQVTTFAVVGDSISSGCSVLMTFPVDNCSWAAGVDSRRSFEYVGGWAHRGTTSTMQAAAVVPVDADLLIILNGTNDLGHSVTVEQQIANDHVIAETVGAPEVVVLAIPPFNHPNPAVGSIAVRNEQLREATGQAGWVFLDPWVQWRDGDGPGWIAGVTQDGVHPTVATWAKVGAVVADEIEQVRG